MIQSQLLTKVRAVHKRTHTTQRIVWKIFEAAGIAREKAEELCKLIPGLKNEIDWSRGASKASKNEVEYKFKNGSKLDIIAASQNSRGKRATGGRMEEVILVDETLLNEVIIPTMNVSRKLPGGERIDEERVNKSQIYVKYQHHY